MEIPVEKVDNFCNTIVACLEEEHIAWSSLGWVWIDDDTLLSSRAFRGTVSRVRMEERYGGVIISIVAWRKLKEPIDPLKEAALIRRIENSTDLKGFRFLSEKSNKRMVLLFFAPPKAE